VNAGIPTRMETMPVVGADKVGVAGYRQIIEGATNVLECVLQ